MAALFTFQPRCVTRNMGFLSRGEVACTVFLPLAGLPHFAITYWLEPRLRPTISDSQAVALKSSTVLMFSSDAPTHVHSKHNIAFLGFSRSASSLAVRRAVPRLPLPFPPCAVISPSAAGACAQPQRSCFHPVLDRLSRRYGTVQYISSGLLFIITPWYALPTSLDQPALVVTGRSTLVTWRHGRPNKPSRIRQLMVSEERKRKKRWPVAIHGAVGNTE